MKGYPKTIGTKQDIYNLAELARQDDEIKDQLIGTLDNLLATRQHFVIKPESAEKPAEEQTSDDYELVDDPGSAMARLGLTLSEIDDIKENL
jgi:hypothetical protein